ncbi:MAG: ABC transporter ATP-binding protein [Gemmatimonadales bacterium]
MNDFGVQAAGLRKAFGEMVAVAGLDLEVRRGEIFGLLGPNGSGKTTTIRMLTGLLEPTAGTAIVAGIDVVAAPEKVRERIGYMSQRFGFYEDLTIDENIRFYGGVYGLTAKERRVRIPEQLARYRLDERKHQLAGTLSGGWKQRLALACATVHHPALVFLDEPTAGVDPASRQLFWKLIREHAAEGTTIIVTTHYMDEAERCDRLGFLSRGHLIGLGTPQEVVDRFGLPSIEAVFVELQRRDEADLGATS